MEVGSNPENMTRVKEKGHSGRIRTNTRERNTN